MRHLVPRHPIDDFGVVHRALWNPVVRGTAKGLPVASAHMMRLATLKPPGFSLRVLGAIQTSQPQLVDLIMLHAIVAPGILQNQYQTVFLNRG